MPIYATAYDRFAADDEQLAGARRVRGVVIEIDRTLVPVVKARAYDVLLSLKDVRSVGVIALFVQLTAPEARSHRPIARMR